MGWLEKEKVLHQRDGEGKLLPISIPLDELKEIGMEDVEVKVLPAPRGELLKHWRETKDLKSDTMEEKEKLDKSIEEFVLKHILEPKFTHEDFTDAKFLVITNPVTKKKEQRTILDILMNAINKASGIKTLEEAEEEVKKK